MNNSDTPYFSLDGLVIILDNNPKAISIILILYLGTDFIRIYKDTHLTWREGVMQYHKTLSHLL